jgi:heptosyltransferase-3
LPEGETGRFRIAVLRSGALGDFILALPILMELRRNAPKAEIVYGGRPAFAELARSCGLADRTLSEDSPDFTSLFLEAGHAPLSAEHPLSGVDLAVTLLGADEVRSSLSRLGVPEVLSVNPVVPSNRATHAADHFASVLASRWNLRRPALPRLCIPRESAEEAQRDLASRRLVPGRFLVVQPGSGSRSKNWGARRFAEAAAKICREAGLDLAVASGPAERDDPSLREALGHRAVGWFEGPRLSHLAAILGEAALYIGNDAGVTHLAAACGTRTVAVFGPTSPETWGPRGSRVHVVRSVSGRLEDVSADDVLVAARRLLET